MNEIIYLVKNNKDNRNKLRQLQLNNGIKEPLKIIYNVVVRWTSLITSIKRILLLKYYIVQIVNESKSNLKEKMDEQIWGGQR